MTNPQYGPPILILPNVHIFNNEPTKLPGDLAVAPLGTLRDQSEIGSMIDRILIKPFYKEEDAIMDKIASSIGKNWTLNDISHCAAIYSTKLATDQSEPQFLNESVKCLELMRDLISVHLKTLTFDPGLVRSLIVSFDNRVEDKNGLGTNLVWTNNGMSKPDKLIRTIVGLSLCSEIQIVDVEKWGGVPNEIDDWDNASSEELFSMTLTYFRYHEQTKVNNKTKDNEQTKDVDKMESNEQAEGLVRALHLLSIGVERHATGDLQVAAALIVSAFENLFPTHGKNKIVSQFTSMGCLLSCMPSSKKWWEDMYDIRSIQLHGGGASAPKTMARLTRDLELTKNVFQLCAHNLNNLQGRSSSELPCFLPADTWRKWIQKHIAIDNQSICTELKKNGNLGVLSGLLFEVNDTTANSRDVAWAGLVIIAKSLLQAGMPLPFFLDDVTKVHLRPKGELMPNVKELLICQTQWFLHFDGILGMDKSEAKSMDKSKIIGKTLKNIQDPEVFDFILQIYDLLRLVHTHGLYRQDELVNDLGLSWLKLSDHVTENQLNIVN